MRLWYGINDIDDAILLGIAAVSLVIVIVQLVAIIKEKIYGHQRTTR